MGLVLDWKKKLGYARDPFDTTVLTPVSRYVTGLEEQKEKFNLFLIKEDRYGTICGDKGTGKTTFLLWMKEQLGGKADAYLLDAAKDKILDTLLTQTTSLLVRKIAKVDKKTPEERRQYLLKRLAGKRVVLLIDNAGALGKEAQELVASIPAHVLCADTKERLAKLELGQDRLALKTPGYTHAQLTEIVRKRIESVGGVGTHPFDEEQLQKLIKQSEGNPAKLLGLARERAIELSLRASPPPTHAPPQEGVKRVGFLNIKIEKGDGPQVVVDEQPPEVHAAPMQEHQDDAALLAEMVEAQEPAKRQASHPVENMDAMIKKIAGSAKPKKAKKKK